MKLVEINNNKNIENDWLYNILVRSLKLEDRRSETSVFRLQTSDLDKYISNKNCIFHLPTKIVVKPNQH